MILAGELPAGSKLNEAAIALKLGVSRGPVREAFRALEESGLVELEKNRGVFVREIRIEEADEIYELRAVLDEFVGRRLAQTAHRPIRCASSPTRVDRMERAAGKGDVAAYLAANVDFHDRLVELAGNAKLLGMYRRLVNELHLFRHATLAQGGVLPVSTREHRAIVERIAARPDGRRRVARCTITSWRAASGCIAPPFLGRGTPAARSHLEEIPLIPATHRRQWPHLPPAGAAARRRLRRRLRARVHQPGDRQRTRAVHRRIARDPAPASPPTASSRRSPIRTTCRSSPARRPRCTASAATTSGTATPAPK